MKKFEYIFDFRPESSKDWFSYDDAAMLYKSRKEYQEYIDKRSKDGWQIISRDIAGIMWSRPVE